MDTLGEVIDSLRLTLRWSSTIRFQYGGRDFENLNGQKR